MPSDTKPAVGSGERLNLPCRWRGPVNPAGRFFCFSAKLHHADDGITLGTCAGCAVRDHPSGDSPPAAGAGRAAAAAGGCRYLGLSTGDTVACDTCPNHKVRLFVYNCHHPKHGLTTLAQCRCCPDRSA